MLGLSSGSGDAASAMALPYHLIDGYNLLHAAGLSRETYGPGDYERARTALLVRICDGLDDGARERTTVVFDAFDPPIDAVSHFRFREVAVRFAVDAGEADHLIEQLIRRHSSPRQLRVVSDDIRVRQAAKRRGAAAVKCDAFLRRLDRYVASEGRSVAESRLPVASPGDWLDYFGLSGDDAKTGFSDLNDAAGPSPLPDHRTAANEGQLPSSQRNGPPAPGRRPAKPISQDIESSSPADDIGYWQRRIEEVLAEERSRNSSRPESS